MKNLRWWLLFLIALGVTVLVALATPSIGMAKVGGVREIVVHARAFEYTPRVIRVQRGERIRPTASVVFRLRPVG